MRFAWLLSAILCEVAATSALKASEGFTRLIPSIIVVFGYGIAFYSLSQTLKSIPLGIAYAIWSGLGTVLVALAGKFIYRQAIDKPAMLGMALVVLGVIIMNVFSKSLSH